MRFAIVLLLIGWAGLDFASAQPKAGRLALLVGVTSYPNLPESLHLKGPANDVLLMQTLLIKQFGFPAENIVALTEHAGSELLPTRRNIEREFRRLADSAKAGDQVVIFLAGHGSQQPEKPGSPNPEPDGLDETFLPRDVGPWQRNTGTVANAITDDELGQWLSDIRAKQAFVWIIVDACHSGTLIRGPNEVARQLDATRDLGIPTEVLRTAQTRGGAERTRGPSQRNRLADTGLVALYACQANEITVEQDQPRNGADAKPYGLFTYTINELVTRSAQPLTYRELVQRVHSHYSQLGRSAPTPQVEGTREDRDREILSQAAWSERSRIVLRTSGTKWKISAGALHGLTAGSILAVLPRTGEKPVGHVRVVDLRTFDADVEPCAFQNIPANERLPDESACVVAQVEYGSFTLKVAVDPNDSKGEPLAAPMAKGLRSTLQKLGETTLLEPVNDFREADWLIRQDAGKLFLIPGSEWRSESAPSFGPYDPDDLARLKNAFMHIARTRALKKLASGAHDIARGPGATPAKLGLDVVRLKSEHDRTGTPVPLDTDSLAFHDGDIVTLHLTNNNRFSVDVTVLYVDSGHGIDVWFPNEEVNRLGPGQRFQLKPVKVTDTTIGLENVVVIAVKARSKMPLDFTCLAQSTLEGVRAKTKSAEAMKSPLGDLLLTGMFGHGDTRSLRSADIQDYQISMVPWKVLPGKRALEVKK